MLGRDRALELCLEALRASSADQTEVVLIAQDQYLTRFATNYIHQNVGERTVRLAVRAVAGDRTGSAATSALGLDDIQGTAARALDIARLQPPNPRFRSLPGPGARPVMESVPGMFDEQTAAYSAAERAGAIAVLVDRARGAGLSAAGSFATGVRELAVVNSLGIAAYAAGTTAGMTAVISSDSGSGYADQTSAAVGSIRPLEVSETAVGKAILAQDPVSLEPGEYTVILEPAAVADLLMFLAFLGFSAQAAQEGRSFMCGRLGSSVMGENITIWDDGLDGAGLPMPFDFEGVPKGRVVLIDRGLAAGFVHDSATAAQEGRLSTGHALPAPNTYGPMPVNLFMAGGDSTLDEMISSTERGILVTRFHYTNPVHPARVVVTGMTRDGTYLIEDGKVARPVRNLRFTDSVPRALSEVAALSRERKLQGGFVGGILVPAIKIGRFAFTGATEF